MNLSPFDVAAHLTTDRQRLEYLRAAVVDAGAGISPGGDALILHAVRTILRSMDRDESAAA